MFGLVPFRNRNLPARDYFDQLMHGFFNDDFLTPFGNMGNAFRVDLRETENEYIVEADLPGVKKGDITLPDEAVARIYICRPGAWTPLVLIMSFITLSIFYGKKEKKRVFLKIRQWKPHLIDYSSLAELMICS